MPKRVDDLMAEAQAELVRLTERLQKLLRELPEGDLQRIRATAVEHYPSKTVTDRHVNRVLVQEIDAELAKRSG